MNKFMIYVGLLTANFAFALDNQKVFVPPVETQEAIEALDWKPPGLYNLPLSKSTVCLPAGYILVLGQDARNFQMLSANDSTAEVEAVAENGELVIVFESNKDGYISLEDWEKIDPIALFEGIENSTESINKNRKKRAFPKMEGFECIQKPTVDQKSNTIWWEYKTKAGQEILYFIIAYKLSRYGHEKITLESRNLLSARDLKIILALHSFSFGQRYSDHQPDDKLGKITSSFLNE